MMWKDILLGFRRGLGSLGATSVALVTLALGIGITASVLSLVRAVVLRPLPFEDPERLVRVSSLRNADGTEETWPVSYLDFLDWKARSHAFADLSVFTDELLLKVPGAEGSDVVSGEMVSSSYFRLLGAKPFLGRTLLPDEDRKPGANNVVVLGHELWRQRFQSDRDVLGKPFELNEASFTVVGVMPAGFQGISDKALLWFPISMAEVVQREALEARKFRWLSVVGRLRPGQTVESAERDLANVAAQLRQEYPDTNDEIGASVEPLALAWFGPMRPVLLLLLGGSILVLLIAYGNLSNLWLADIIARRPEMGLRTVLGADRGRLIRQLLTETLLLILIGAILGLGVATFGNRAIAQSTGIALRSFVRVRIDPFVLGAILGLATLLGLLFGSLSAFWGTGSSLGSLARGGGGGETVTVGRRGRWLQSLLIVYEVTLATVLLLGAGLMTEDFLHLSRVDLGFRTDHLLTVRTMTKGQRYADDEQMRSVILHAIDRLSALPGVTGVTFAGPAIPTDQWHGFHVTLENRGESDPEDSPLVLRHHVSPGYFRTLGIPVLRGRDFSTGDRDGALPVVVVSDAMARRFWPRENPLGKRLKLGAGDSKFPWLTVVGVAGDVKHEGRGGEARPGPDVYLPILQSIPRNPPVLNFMVRCSVSPGALAPAVIKEFRRAAPSLPTYDVKTMEERLAKQVSAKKLFTGLMIASALLALLLSTVGIYGVVSCIVRQRLRELGIRTVFGATPSHLTRLLVGQGFRLALVGIGCGLLATLALRRLATSSLYPMGTLEPALITVMSVLLTSLVVVACYVPVRRVLKAKSLMALTRGLGSVID